jgi:uncharacterized protein (TIGR02757 family)
MAVISKKQLETIYTHYNCRKWVHPDPLEFLYHYPHFKDREVVGLIASSLAYGRVTQILKSVSWVLDRMGPSPYAFLKTAPTPSLRKAFDSFKHRFTTGEEMILLLRGLQRVIKRFGTLYTCFLHGSKEEDASVLPGLSFLATQLSAPFSGHRNSLLPLPSHGSACKRLHLFLRWMVREDGVDPGGWKKVSPAKLIVPLDTHMHRICRGLNFTERKSGNLRTALEITSVFREITPEDPVRYDFALTRLGIRGNKGSDLPRTSPRLEKIISH